jgi:hypothetical protein
MLDPACQGMCSSLLASHATRSMHQTGYLRDESMVSECRLGILVHCDTLPRTVNRDITVASSASGWGELALQRLQGAGYARNACCGTTQVARQKPCCLKIE